jgi:hypothetical protein
MELGISRNLPSYPPTEEAQKVSQRIFSNFQRTPLFLKQSKTLFRE